MGELATRVRNATHRFTRRALITRVRDAGWRGQAMAVAAALGLLLYMVRVLGKSWPKKFAIFFPDSFSYLKVARLTPFSFSFYSTERPIAFPTLLFLVGRSVPLAVVVQTFLYGLVYLFAAATVLRVLRQREARLVIAFVVLTIAIEPRFALWNTHILSESLGMTLAAASLVCWWRFAAAPSGRRLNWAGIATVGWLCVRDSNVPPWLALGVPALLIASFRWRSVTKSLRTALWVWGIITLFVGVTVTLTQSASGRNRWPTMNNVGTRVLPDPEITKWFVDQGMPLDAALVQRTGQNAFDDNWDMLRSPDLTNFRHWVDNGGQRVLLMSYVRFAPHWIASLSRDLPAILRSDMSAYDAFGVESRLPERAPAQINGPATRTGLLVWTLLSALSLVVAALRRRRVEAVVLGLLLASTFIDLYIAYIGDSVEVFRHMMGPLARMALIMVICVGVGLDSSIGWLRSRRAGPPTELALEVEPEVARAALVGGEAS